MPSHFSYILLILALYFKSTAETSSACGSTDYTAIIDDLCSSCSYPNSNSYSGFTCTVCEPYSATSYGVLNAQDGTQQKCMAYTTTGNPPQKTTIPTNLVFLSESLYECGQGCNSCTSVPNVSPSDYQCSKVIDSSRIIIRHPTYTNAYMNVTTYSCDAFYINTNGAYQGYYYYSNSGASECRTCSTNCFSCSQANPTLCTECVYSKARFSSLTTFYNALSTTGAVDCSTMSSRSSTATLTYYLRPQGTACPTTPCANTVTDYTTYYDSFYDIMTDLIDNQNIQEKTSITVTIYIFKNSAGEIGQIYLTHSFPDSSKSLLYGRMFERVLSTVTIQAAEKCQTNFGQSDNTYCYDVSNNERPQIYLKSAYIFFFVTNSFTLQNVDFHGGDLMKAFDTTIRTQYSSYCDPTLTGTISQTACKPSSSSWFYMDPLDPSSSTPNYYKKNVLEYRPNGLFVLQYIRDVAIPVVPQLTITGCSIYNFYQHKHAFSFIYFEEAGFITITNNYFYNMFFVNGLISNTPPLNFEIQKTVNPNSFYRLRYNVDRGNPYTSKNKGVSCKSHYFGLSNVITTDCHQINITLSSFQSFNPYQYRRVPLNSYVSSNNADTNLYNTYDYTTNYNSNAATADSSDVNYNIFQEGLLLGVTNINGKIHLSNNQFEAALSSVNHRLDLQHNCAPFQFTHGFTPDKNEENIDIVSSSSYKLNIDKHMRQHLEAEERVISSLIYIRELHDEFIMFNNTFDSIIAETGSVLFVEDFTTSSSYPIMINSNKFTNNLAYAFGANIVFKKNANDLTQLDCVSIVINGNQFSNNVGCTNTYGNVIISCEPNHPAACPTQSSVFSSLFYDIPGVSSQNTWATTFSSYYTYYNFKVNNLLETISNNDIYLETAYDLFILNKSLLYTENYDTTNPLVNPYTGDQFPYNVFIYSNNTCSTNYLLISNCIYIEGSMGILMENNNFLDNGVPLEDFFSQPFYQHSGFNSITGNTIQSGFIENIYLTMMKEASPVVIRIGSYVHMNNCFFQDNFAVFVGDFYIGSCITMEKMLGNNNITIENGAFLSHAGYDRFFIQPTASYYYDYCSFPLIAVNHWVNLKQFNALNVFTLNRQIKMHTILIQNCEFSSNIFYLTAYKPNTNPTIKTNLTKTNFYALITYTKVTPAANFQYNLQDPTKFTMQNSGSDSSKYLKLTTSTASPELYSFIFHHFLDQEVDSSASSFAFNLEDYTNLFPLFQSIQLVYSGCTFQNNYNYVGLPFIYTFNFNFSFINCNYSSNILSEAPNIFALAPTITTLAHIVQNSGTSYSSSSATINFTQNTFYGNQGLLLSIGDSANVLPILVISGLYIESHAINKSAIICIDSMQNANVNNIIMISSTYNSGVIGLYTLSKSTFSNLNFSMGICQQIACVYGVSLTNVVFTNITCTFMNVVSPYYLSIQIDPSLLSKTQPTSSIIMNTCTNISFINLYYSDLSLAHNGLFTVTSTIYITNFTVLNCFSGQEWPSGVYVTSDSSVYINIGAFYNITCYVCSGTLFIVELLLNITNCNFINVTSDMGLLYAEDSTVNIAFSQFINNTAIDQDPTIMGIGGVISIYSSEFINNTCLSEDTLSFLSSEVYIFNTSFYYNLAQTKTKGIFFSECFYASIVNCFFVDYQVGNSIIAGFIYSMETTLVISGSTFDGSISKNGAVYAQGDSSYLIISTSNFINNQASLDSPALYASIITTINTSYFDNNNVIGSSSSKAGHVLIESTDEALIIGCNFSNFSTNAVYLSNIINVTISGSLFYGNLSTIENRGIYLTNCYNVFFQSTIFKYLVTQSSGAGFYLTSSSSNNVSLIINQTLFFNNIALNGGGMAIILSDNGILTNYISNSTFYMNYANNDGGGFYYNSQNVKSIFNLSYTIISCNNAYQAGGGFRFMGMVVSYDGTSHIFNNTAYYGPNIAAYPIHMMQRVLKSPDEYTWYVDYIDSGSSSRLLTNLSSQVNDSILNQSLGQINNFQPNFTDIPNNFLINESIINEALSQINTNVSNNPSFNLPTSVPATLFNELVSGQNQIPPMIFDLIDYYGQIVGTYNSSTLTITLKGQSGTKMNDISTFTPFNGSYILYPFNMHGIIGTAVSLDLTTDAMTNISGMTYPANFTLQSNYSFSSIVRPCQRNEYLTDNGECWECKSGFYNGDSATCQACDIYTTNCLGGDYVGPIPGYWRLNGYILNVLPCLTYSSCLGSNVTDISPNYYCAESLWVDPNFCVNGWCGEGYQGIFCYDCVDGWAHSNDSCVPCSNNGQYYGITVLIVIIAIAYIVFTIKKALAGKKEERKKSNKSAILMKILTNYFQLISIVSSFNFNWSGETQTMISGQSQTSEATGQIFNFDCVLKALGTSNIGMRPFFLKLSFIAVFPIIAYFICKVVWFIIFFKRYKKEVCQYVLQMKSKLTTSIIVILFIIHPTIVKTSIFSFRCENLGNTNDPIYYLDQDFEIQCWESYHLKWIFIVAVPALIIWGFGIPMAAFFHIRRNLDKIYDYEFKQAYGFLYDGYRLERYFWEFVILYRKIVMVFISVFLVTFSLETQALAILAVSFISYLIQIKSQPFLDPELNEAEKRALINSSFTIYAGLYYISGNLPKEVDILLLVLMVLVNANFVYIWLKAYLSEQYIQLKEAGTLDKVLKKFQKKKKKNKVAPAPPIVETKEEQLQIKDLEDVGSNDIKVNPQETAKGSGIESMIGRGSEENNQLIEEMKVGTPPLEVKLGESPREMDEEEEKKKEN